ncbi:MAG TPA: aminoacetone oxidase family FAD-binding enzyme [Ruminococcus sp.]|nr:aminoacetone oxidase family FAD-binding enzyme [Ruminococcus sp.]
MVKAVNYDVIIAGGGAAGCMAAVRSSLSDRITLVIEPNKRLGRKLMITGKGRCNVTNDCSVEELMNNIPVNPKFLYSAFSEYSSYDTMTFFEMAGVPLKTERGNRVFPVSDKAEDIVKVFEHELKRNKVDILHDKVTELIIDNGICHGVRCGQKEIYSESVLIATGGKSYPQTGSTGDGYTLARQAGHTITEIKPSLVPVVSEESYCRDMMGLSLKNVTLSLYDRKKCIYKELGEMLFTHFGISGPLVLSASSHIRKMEKNRYSIKIDLKPALSPEQLDKRIQRDFSEMLNRSFSNSLNKLLPAKMIPVIVKLSGIPAECRVNSITKQQRKNLAELIKNFPVSVKGFRPVEEAIITSGGVSVKEINPKTMESKLVKGLYFAGEVIDVDAYTGGFNLQIAFSTGYCAGHNM